MRITARSSQMDNAMHVSLRTILCAAVAVFAIASGGQAEQAGQLVAVHVLDRNRMAKWDIRSTPVYAYGDFTFSLAGGSDVQADAQGPVGLQIRHGDLPFARRDFAASYGTGGIGVFEMGQGEPVLVMATYSGGAHCCTHFNFLSLTSPAAWTAAGGFDGDIFDLEDIDGDAIFEIARPDPRFRHAEGAMAGLWAAPLILGFRDGQLSDVTDEPRYRSYLTDAGERVAEYCGGEEGWFVEGCVAWGAIGQRLGALDAVLQEIAARVEAAPPDTGMAQSGFDAIDNEIEETIRTLKLSAQGAREAIPNPL